MGFKISTGLQTHLLTTLDLKSGLDGLVFKIYGSPTSSAIAKSQIPTSANAAVLSGDTILLCTVSVNGDGTGCTFDDTPVSGALYKTASELWFGTNVGSGYPAFYRLETDADTGASSTTNIRCQGTVGQIGTDLIIAAAYMSTGQEQRIDSYVIGQPLE